MGLRWACNYKESTEDLISFVKLKKKTPTTDNYIQLRLYKMGATCHQYQNQGRGIVLIKKKLF